MEGKVRRIKAKQFKNISRGGMQSCALYSNFFKIFVLPIVKFSSSGALWAWMILNKGYGIRGLLLSQNRDLTQSGVGFMFYWKRQGEFVCSVNTVQEFPVRSLSSPTWESISGLPWIWEKLPQLNWNGKQHF